MPTRENINHPSEFRNSKENTPSGSKLFKPNHFHPGRNLRDVFPQLIVESISNPRIKPLMLALKPSFEGAPCFSPDCRELNLSRKAA